MTEYYSGRVQSVVFANDANAYYIVRMFLDGDDSDGSDLFMDDDPLLSAPVTVKGNVAGIGVQPGTWFGFEGRWVNDPKYGRQISISRAPVLRGQGWDPDTACKMLVANGVGPSVMQAIREHIGDASLLAALDDPQQIEQTPGLDQFTALHVQARWEAVQAQFKTLDFLSSLGLPSGYIGSIWGHFGDDTERVLTKDPWALVQVDGITFQQADEVARKLGLSDEPAQVRGAVLSTVKNSRGFGHLYLSTGAIFYGVRVHLPDIEATVVAQALKDLHKDNLIVIDKSTRPGTTAVYEPWCYAMEKESAALLCERQRTAALEPSADRTRDYINNLGSVGPQTEAEAKKGRKRDRLERVVWVAIDEWGSQAHLVLSDPQKEGVFNALTAPVSVLAGLPGTGKTTSLKAAVQILQDAGVSFLLVAPTGIAAKNLSARAGATASTIHRAFAAKGINENRRERTYLGVVGESSPATLGGSDGEWGFSQDHPHPADVIIVDEASMVDQHLLYRLLDCTKPDARLVFVGDYAQLPGVGPGNVLRDLIHAQVFPTVKLDQIFRQDDTSGIVYAAHAMHRGEVPDTDPDFRLIPVQDEGDVLETVLKIAERFYGARVEFQIVSPKHRGTVGVTNLNERLRELLNPKSPGKTEMKVGALTVREGDRIMVIKNNYRFGIFNGDVGKIFKVDRGKREVTVKIHGDVPHQVTIPFKDVQKLMSLGYAATVHKVQGLEFDRIVMPLVTGFYHQLQRNLLYTAVTRARQQVVLVGHRDALIRAVNNAKEDDRATLFLDRLTGGIQPAPSE